MTQYAAIRGHRCGYDHAGTGGPRILLVMGFGMGRFAWRPQVDGLAPHATLVAYDNRGIGDSGTGLPITGLADLADDAAALLDHLGWEDAHVVGVSMGGMVAQHLALKHRARVRSLALIATSPAVWRYPPTPEGMRLFLQANSRKGEARMAALAKLLFPGEHLAAMVADGWSPAELASIAVPSDPAARLTQLRALLAHDTRAELPQLAGLRTLVIQPERDVLVPPAASAALARLIPGARLLPIPNTGHGVMSQAADLVNTAILEHIQRG